MTNQIRNRQTSEVTTCENRPMKGYDVKTYGERWSPYYDEVDEAIIDLLSRHAGQPPRARLAGWRWRTASVGMTGGPFTERSTNHMSIYRKPG